MKAKTKKITVYSLAVIGIALAGITGYLKFLLPDVEAAEYLEVEVTPERVERGEYLANHVAVCMDCHSSRDWSRYSAPLVPGTLGQGGEYFGPEMGFPGKFYARNLTPTNLEHWTDGEIYRAITSGVSKDGKALFPVMPYLNYGKMNKEDVYDIIAYLRTLPPMENEIPPSEPNFLMSLILNTIPQDATPTTRPDRSNKVRYGGYLANAAGCIECHTQTKNGQIIPELAYSGGREFKLPNGVLHSANITPDLETGIGSWDKDSFVARFKAFSNPNATPTLAEDEPNTLMPWVMYAGMEEEDLEAIYAFLQSLEPINNEVVTFAAPGE